MGYEDWNLRMKALSNFVEILIVLILFNKFFRCEDMNKKCIVLYFHFILTFSLEFFELKKKNPKQKQNKKPPTTAKLRKQCYVFDRHFKFFVSCLVSPRLDLWK